MTAEFVRPYGSISVDVCVCTFRRPALADTIASVTRLAVPFGVTPRVIVADNDVTRSAEALAASLAESLPFTLVYLHAPARNISVARNACLDAATGDYLAFVDDDETVTESWLSELLATATTTGADAVLGPVRALYAADAPAWMKRADIHATRPVWAGAAIRAGYTCNVLLNRASPAIAGRRFDVALGRSGGEDTAYFTGLAKAGGTVAYAPDAWVEEPVPADRATFSWLARRRFRMGQTHGRLLAQEASPSRRLKQAGIAAAKAAYCFAAAAILAPMAARRNVSILRGLLHAGAVAGVLGMREIAQYGVVASVPEVRDAT